MSNRVEAGRRLGTLLERYAGEQTVICALPRGGVVVGYQIAHRLGAPLHAIVARRLDAPSHPEIGFGAIADGVRLVDGAAARMLRLTEDDIAEAEARERNELQRRERVYGGGAIAVAGRTVILVDDGAASGLTARAALAALQRRGAARRILAVPVCPPATAAAFRTVAGEVVTLATPADFRAVALCYEEFEDVPEVHVLALLAHARSGFAGPGPV